MVGPWAFERVTRTSVLFSLFVLFARPKRLFVTLKTPAVLHSVKDVGVSPFPRREFVPEK